MHVAGEKAGCLQAIAFAGAVGRYSRGRSLGFRRGMLLLSGGRRAGIAAMIACHRRRASGRYWMRVLSVSGVDPRTMLDLRAARRR